MQQATALGRLRHYRRQAPQNLRIPQTHHGKGVRPASVTHTLVPRLDRVGCCTLACRPLWLVGAPCDQLLQLGRVAAQSLSLSVDLMARDPAKGAHVVRPLIGGSWIYDERDQVWYEVRVFRLYVETSAPKNARCLVSRM